MSVTESYGGRQGNDIPWDAPAADRIAAPAGSQRLLRTIGAVAVVGGPLCYLVGGALSPAVHTTGAATIAANATVDGVSNGVHLIAFVLGSYLLPISIVALAWLIAPNAPRLATAGGIIGVLGWLPFSALTALDALAAIMAQGDRSATDPGLYDRFAYGAVMNSYLLVYIVCHLVAYVLLGIGLRRARAIPAWASWAVVASSPVLVAAFVLPGQLSAAAFAGAIGSVALLLIGSVPAASALLPGQPRRRAGHQPGQLPVRRRTTKGS